MRPQFVVSLIVVLVFAAAVLSVKPIKAYFALREREAETDREVHVEELEQAKTEAESAWMVVQREIILTETGLRERHGALRTVMPGWAGSGDNPFDVDAFVKERTPSVEQNGAKYLLLALAELEPDLAFVFPAEERDDAVERTIQRSKQIRLASERHMESPEEVPNEDMQSLVALSQSLDAYLAQAFEKSIRRLPMTVSFRTILPQAKAARSLIRLKLLEASHHVRHGHSRNAIEVVEMLLLVNDDLRRGAPLISSLVTCAAETLLYEEVFRSFISNGTASVEDCDLLISVLLRHRVLTADFPVEAMRVEYICGLNAIADIESGRRSGEYFDIGPVELVANDFNKDRNAWKSLFEIVEAQNSLSLREILSTRTIESAIENLKPKQGVDIDKSTQVPRATLMMFPAYTQFRRACTRREARLSCTLAIVAADRFRKVHGEWPTRDEFAHALTEAGIDQDPIDPYSEKLIGYAIVGGEPVAYAIGPDFVDDGGLREWDFQLDDPTGDLIMRVGWPMTDDQQDTSERK